MKNKTITPRGLSILDRASARRNNIFPGNLFAPGGQTLVKPPETIPLPASQQMAKNSQLYPDQLGVEAGKALLPGIKKTDDSSLGLDQLSGLAGHAQSSLNLYTKNLTPETLDTTGETGWSKQELMNWSRGNNSGMETNSVWKSGLQDAMTGAAAGTSIMPGWGSLIGTGVGLINGTMTALIGNSAKRKRNREIRQAMSDKVSGMNAAINQDAANSWLTNNAAYGGQFSTGVDRVTTGGTHEENPLGGIPVSVDEEGKPNLVEEGEVRWNNYIFSNRVRVPREKGLLGLVGLPSSFAGKSFSDAAALASKESSERENDPISLRGLEDTLSKLRGLQELSRESPGASRKFAGGGDIQNLRYAPLVQNALSGLESLFEKPDRLTLGRLSAPVVTDRATYTPYDTQYLAGPVRQQANATNRYLADLSGGNRGIASAMILANNRASQNQLSKALLQGRQYNDQLRANALQFNAGISQFNAGNELEARKVNLQQLNAEREYYKKSRAARANAIRQSMAALFDGLGGIGTENYWGEIARETTGYDPRGKYTGLPGTRESKK